MQNQQLTEDMIQSIKQFKPWEQYPEIWQSEAAFWTYLRGAIRGAVWNKSPIKLDFKNKRCNLPPPEGYTGRGKKFGQCEHCKQIVMKTGLEVDHKTGEMPLLHVNHIMPFMLHSMPPPNSLQLLCKECHKAKSHYERYADKYDFKSIDEARAHKRMIDFFKQHKGAVAQQRAASEFNVSFGCCSNEKQRKAVMYEYFKSVI